jgi:hypothetical protein
MGASELAYRMKMPTANVVYRAYGSGYPGVFGRGVVGRGFPYFWPIAWGTHRGHASNAGYLYTDEVR